MGWPGIDYEELGELSSILIGRDLVPIPRQALARIEKNLKELKRELDDFHARSGYAIAGDCSTRVGIIQAILHDPNVIGEEEVSIQNGPGT